MLPDPQTRDHFSGWGVFVNSARRSNFRWRVTVGIPVQAVR
jgi:hypothetical protein